MFPFPLTPFPEPLIAQVIAPDLEHPTGTQITIDNTDTNITGGTTAGDNLFHSFESFGLSQEQTANFILANPNIQNILSRVVGGDVSVIDGILRVTGGDANLFLMNPSGVIFGPNAQLRLPANLSVTTADGILLDEALLGEQWFNAVGPNDYETLVGMPSGFGFVAAQPGGIANAGELSLSSGDLALVGGTVINMGQLNAEAGRLIVTTVPGQNLVRLQSAGDLLNLEIEPLGGDQPTVGSGSIATLPELLTGGSADPMVVFEENPDGSVQVKTLDVSVNQGDVVSTTMTAGVIGVMANDDIITSDVRSTGGAIYLISQMGDIDMSQGHTHAVGGAITLQGLGDITTGDLKTQGDDISILSSGVQTCLFGNFFCSLSGGGEIDTTSGILDSTDDGSDGGAISLQARETIATGEIYSGSGDITLLSGDDPAQLVLGQEIATIDVGSIESGGGNVRLNALSHIETTEINSDGGNIEVVSARGEITTRGDTDSTGAATVPGGEITLIGLQAVEVAPIFSNGGSVNVRSRAQAVTRTGVIDTTSNAAAGAAISDGDLTIRENTPQPLAPGSPPDTIVTGDGQFIYDAEEVGGPNPGDAPPAPPSILRQIPLVVSVPPPAVEPPVVEPPVVESPAVEPPAVEPPVVEPPPATARPPAEETEANPAPPPTEEVSTLAASSPNANCGPDSQLLSTDAVVGQRRPFPNIASPSSLSHPADALRCYQNLLAQAQDSTTQGIALYNLGALHYDLGDYAQAEESFEQSLALAQTQGEILEKGYALQGLAATHSARGNYTKAIHYYQAALETAQPDQTATLLGDLGMVYYAQKDYAQAQTALLDSLTLAQQTQDRVAEAATLSHLGLVYYSLTDYDQADLAQQQSLAIAQQMGDRNREGRALENLGLIAYARQDYPQAIDYHQQSLGIAQQLGDRHAEARAFNNLGDTLYKAGHPGEAVGYLRGAIAIWDSVRDSLGNRDLDRIAIFETHETTYSTLQRVLVESGQPEAALEVTEQGRARAFVNLLSQASGTDATIAQVRPPNLTEIKQTAQAQNSTLVSYAIVQDTVDTQGVRALQPTDLYIWVVKPSGEIHFHQETLSPLYTQGYSLEQLVSDARCLANTLRCQKRNQSQLSATGQLQYQALQQLHQLLINPIADWLPSDPTAHVTFIPHQALFQVPFAALQDETGRHLIEHHTLLSAPSIQTLGLTGQKQTVDFATLSRDDFLIVGNPAMPMNPRQLAERSQRLPELLTSEFEAKTLAGLLQTDVLTGDTATEPAVIERMASAKVIHLATHGFLDDLDGQGLPGAIALAPTAQSDGLLTAQEIFDLDLNADLAVLSACDTGGGRITGDGVVGLSRSLMSAGVPSVVVSLWKVPEGSDQGSPTVDLMISFYETLEKQNDKAQALRQAMLSTMEQYPEPEYWAAFSLMGSPL
ncbi:MAG: CHAT domain-containing protein [Cyanobacteria bacterium J06635_1]